MVKRFQIIEVAEVTTEDGIYYYKLDGLLVGGYENGKLINTKPQGQANDGSGATPSLGPGTSGVVQAPKPRELKRQQEAEAEREISTLEGILPKGGK